jgi:hypothetical protein
MLRACTAIRDGHVTIDQALAGESLAGSSRWRTSAPRSGFLVLADLAQNLVPVCALKSPSIGQVLGAQRRVGLQDLGVTGTLLSEHNQGPDWYPCSYDASVTAADIRRSVDTGKGVAEITHDLLQKLSLLRSGHPCQKPFGFFNCGCHRELHSLGSYHSQPTDARRTASLTTPTPEKPALINRRIKPSPSCPHQTGACDRTLRRS